MFQNETKHIRETTTNNTISETESNNETEMFKTLKTNFVNALKSDEFCCICWNYKELQSIYDIFAIELTTDVVEMRSVKQILLTLFKGTEKFSSSKICNTCLKCAAEAFIFIAKAKLSWKYCNEFANEIDSKIIDFYDNISKENATCLSNLLIVLEDPILVEPEKSGTNNVIHNEVGENIYKCDYCDKIFTVKRTLLWHMKFIHEIIISDVDYKNKSGEKQLCSECEIVPCIHSKHLEAKKCMDCDFQCSNKLELIEHINEKHLCRTVTSCDFCDKEIYSHHSYKKHILSKHSKTYKCNVCDLSFTHKLSFNKHVDICKENILLVNKDALQRRKSSPEGMFECEICQKKLTTHISYRYHKKRHETKETRKPCNLICEICHTKLPSLKAKKVHMKSHTPDQKPNCPECKLTFDSLSKYRHHNFHKHKDAKYHCQFCDYSCTVVFQLDAHINRHHLKTAPYQCKECHKYFVGRSTLICHMKIHTKGMDFQCELCGNYLSTSAGLKKHMRRHTGEKPYVCEICGEGFVCATTRSLHKVKEHTDERVKCPLCDAKFVTASMLRSHVKAVHWKNKNAEFDYKKIEGITPEHYDIFRDKRMIQIEGAGHRTCEVKRRTGKKCVDKYENLIIFPDPTE